MSNDLISRKALMEEIEKSMNNNTHIDPSIKLNHRNEHVHFMSMVIKFPTSYDIDAVCKELKRLMYEESSCEGAIWIRKCIDIVRNGGKKQ